MLGSDVGIGKRATPFTMVPATFAVWRNELTLLFGEGRPRLRAHKNFVRPEWQRAARCGHQSPLAVEAPYGLADPVDLHFRHANEQRQRQALPRIPVCYWEALGISCEASQRRLGMQGHGIMQAGFDSRSLHIFAQLIAILAAHDVEVEHVVVV